jgi:hypothetical protein
MKGLWKLVVPLVIVVGAALPASASRGTPRITGGGSANDMTRFALAVSGGTGHFECLMPAVMTVQATVIGVDDATPASAAFHGVATVNLSAGNPFGLPAGPMAKDVSYTATVLAGGPGSGFVDLEILGMKFAGTLVHGQITITP